MTGHDLSSTAGKSTAHGPVSAPGWAPGWENGRPTRSRRRWLGSGSGRNRRHGSAAAKDVGTLFVPQLSHC